MFNTWKALLITIIFYMHISVIYGFRPSLSKLIDYTSISYFTIKRMSSSSFPSSSLSSSGSSTEPTTPAMDSETLVHNLQVVQNKIEAVRLSSSSSMLIRLVAVSKTKPAEYIKILYDQGHRDFGENYFQELVDKVEILPKDIRWHFIGHLQSSKASKLIRLVPNLAVIETIDSLKLASKLQSACESVGRTSLDVFIQVDTSNEDTKSGVDVDEVLPLAQSILLQCPALRIKGLMTIGAPDDYSCFDKLVSARDHLASGIGIDKNTLELSMGMSGDFEEAIRRGATSVRIGSTLFGPRMYPPKM